MTRFVCFAAAALFVCDPALAAEAPLAVISTVTWPAPLPVISTVTWPVRWTTAYAPETNLEKLDVALIEQARSRIDFAAYVLTDVAVIDALTAAAGRGVAVRIYRNGGQATAGAFVAGHLAALVAAPGVKVRTKASFVLMHLKSFAVDGRVLRGGAANFSASGLKHQDNDRWETDDPAAVARFEHTFETMWTREGDR